MNRTNNRFNVQVSKHYRPLRQNLLYLNNIYVGKSRAGVYFKDYGPVLYAAFAI